MYSFTNYGGGRQNRTLHVGLTMQAGHKVNITICHDTSYANQSSARAEVWSPTDLAWHLAATYFYSEWADDTSPGSAGREGPTAGIESAYEELVARVEALLS